MKCYRVKSHYIDVDAESPEEAAEIAHMVHTASNPKNVCYCIFDAEGFYIKTVKIGDKKNDMQSS